jgi:hypothetical protein
MNKLSLGGLKSLCETHLVELKFIRRNKTSLNIPTRRMLCTRDMRILNSELGKITFNFIPPSSTPAYNATSKNLLTVFDIIFQDWRNIPVENTMVIMAIPTNPQKIFWEYFDRVLRKMTKKEKQNFIIK